MELSLSAFFVMVNASLSIEEKGKNKRETLAFFLVYLPGCQLERLMSMSASKRRLPSHPQVFLLFRRWPFDQIFKYFGLILFTNET
jgi:hypothetical protein